MIIKTGGIKSGDGHRICSYVTQQGENEYVEVIRDEADQLLVSDDFAQLKGRKNGLLHIIISPDQELSPEQLAATVTAIRAEFGFNPNDPETLTRHQSRRADGSLHDHYHLVRQAQDSASGKTYKLFRSKAKDEAVSRLCELKFSHKLTNGASNSFAEMRLREMGEDELADQLAAAFDDQKKPRAAYSSDDHQAAKRQDFDLPVLRQKLKELAKLPRDQQPAVLAELIDEQDLELADAVAEGRGRSRIMIETPEGMKDHNANRTLKIKPPEVAQFIHETKEFLHDRRCKYTERSNLNSGSVIADHRASEPDIGKQRSNDPTPECASENLASDHQDLSEEQELALAADYLKPKIDKFGRNSAAEFDAADLEPIPDIRDPNLMRKLAAILKRQADRAAALVRVLRAGGSPASYAPKE